MKKIILIMFLVVLLSISVNTSACTSDFNCGYGEKCVKPPLKTSGECMKTVDEHGTKTNIPKSTKSVLPNMNTQGDCSFDTDCPIGFRCDRQYKACIKR